MLMINQINQFLLELNEYKITRQTRAANMQCFQFGELIIIDEQKAIGALGLHLSSPWNITNQNEIIIGSGDLYEQSDEAADYDENYDYYKLDANLRDVKLRKLINENTLSIISIFADKYGGLIISFNDNITLNIFPDVSSKNGNEFWRLLDNRPENKKHIVSCSTGYEII